MFGLVLSLAFSRPSGSVSGDPWTIGEWTAGSNTILSVDGNLARATRSGGNPRISREVSGLQEGTTYRVQTTGYAGTAGSAFFRVDDDVNLSDGTYVNSGGVGSIDQNFVAPAGGTVYIGIVGVTSNDGEYVEIDEEFTLEVV